MVAAITSRARASMLAAILPAAFALFTSCSIIEAHPFPDYLSGIEKEIDISDRIQTVLKSAVSARYEIGNVTTSSGDRVLVLVDPVVSEPTEGSPTPALLIFDRTLGYLATVVPQSPLGYVGRPYAVTADGNILSGDTVFDPTTGELKDFDPSPTVFVGFLNPTGLAGYGFPASIGGAPHTVVVSLPAGQSSAATLTVEIYDDIWSAPNDYVLNIVSNPSTSQQSYLLNGARLESDGDTLTLLVRDKATNAISVVRTSLAAVTSSSAPALLDTAPVASIDGTAATAYVTDGDIVLHRTAGSFERYSADGKSMSSSVTSDRRTGVVYGFSPDGAYLYRLDPATGSFLLIRSWW